MLNWIYNSGYICLAEDRTGIGCSKYKIILIYIVHDNINLSAKYSQLCL